MFSTVKFNNYLLWSIFFLSFLGFYVMLLIVFNAGMSQFSRLVTVPVRIVVALGCLYVFFKNFNNKSPYLIYFLFFAVVYISRIFIDFYSREFLYISYDSLFFYFISFALIPFLGFSKISYNRIDYEKFYIVFLISALAFSSLTLLLYGKYIGQISRLSTNSTGGEEVLSPLVLSYCGSLIMGVVIFYLLYSKNIGSVTKYLSYVAIALALIPFFLGASRGSIFAVFFPFLFMASCNLSFKNILRYSLVLAVIIVVLIYLDGYLGSGLVDRFVGTTEAIEKGGSSASRLEIWKKSWSQFVNFPFIGDKLNTEGFNIYPHNIYLEVLQTTGILGFIPFVALIAKTFQACYNIFRNHIQYAWIAVFFLQAVMRHIFSGALYNAAWFWISMAMVLSLNYYFKKNNIINQFN